MPLLELAQKAFESGAVTSAVLLATAWMITSLAKAYPSVKRARDEGKLIRQAVRGKNKAQRDRAMTMLKLLRETAPIALSPPEDRGADPPV